MSVIDTPLINYYAIVKQAEGTMGIKCPKCHFENPDDTLYCGKCATQLPSLEEISPFHTKTLETPTEELARGTTFAGRYEIIEELEKIKKYTDLNI